MDRRAEHIDKRHARAQRRWDAFKVKTVLIVGFFVLASIPSFHASPRDHASPLSSKSPRPSVSRILLDTDAAESECDDSIHAAEDACTFVKERCGDAEGALDYLGFHYCVMGPGLEAASLLALVAVVLLNFYLLGETAEEYFCVVVRKLTVDLNLAPSTAGVTFLALGNGAPDVFASLAAFVGGDGKIGLGAIVSAGSFVSGFVVGSVAVAAAPFEVDKGPYVRDVVFYLVAALGVFAVCFGGTVHIHHALSFVLFYVVYVVVVIVQDRGMNKPATPPYSPIAASYRVTSPRPTPQVLTALVTYENADADLAWEGEELGSTSTLSMEGVGARAYPKGAAFLNIALAKAESWARRTSSQRGLERVKNFAWAPVDLLRRLTVPMVEEEQWDKFWVSCCVACGPVFLFLNCAGLVDPATPVFPHMTGRYLPLWLLVLGQSCALGTAFYNVSDHDAPPTQRWIHFSLMGLAFVTSIAWISIFANELLGCLNAIGMIMGISPTILGVTVLAWGNSVGDLVADVVIARAGQPKMAVAGCYAGPMFNMLIGLGLALAIKTTNIYPNGYKLPYHPNVPISFGFLFACLLGSLAAVALSRFRITRPWGVCLITLYVLFMAVSILVELQWIRLDYHA